MVKKKQKTTLGWTRSSYKSSETMSIVPSFLVLPAEIRVQIYGYLLSTTYTKHYPRAEDAVGYPKVIIIGDS